MIKDCQVGVKALVVVDGKCLVLKSEKNEYKYWDLPGGRVEDSEMLEDTLRRELKEELPTLQQYTIDGVVSAHRLSHDILDGKGLVFVFFKIKAEKFNIELTNDHTGYQWVDKNTISSLHDSGFKIEEKYYEAICRALEKS